MKVAFLPHLVSKFQFGCSKNDGFSIELTADRRTGWVGGGRGLVVERASAVLVVGLELVVSPGTVLSRVLNTDVVISALRVNGCNLGDGVGQGVQGEGVGVGAELVADAAHALLLADADVVAEMKQWC